MTDAATQQVIDAAAALVRDAPYEPTRPADVLSDSLTGDHPRWGRGDRHHRTGTDGGTGTDDETPDASSFDRIDLGPIVDGNYTQPTPDLLVRSDGQHLFYRGQVNGLHSDSGTGKGWVICLAIVQVIMAGGKAMLLDLEDVPGSIVARLRLLGLTDAQIVNGLDYRRPTEQFTRTEVDRLCVDIANEGHALVVVDSLGEAFALSGVNEDKDAEVGPWLRHVARRLADAGAAVVLVDHATKAADNPLHPSGSKRKRAAIGGASYLLEAVAPLAKGRGGRLKLTCAKDRHGTFARKDVVANLVVGEHVGVGPLDVGLYAPDPDISGGGPEVALLVIAQEMIRKVKDSTDPLSKSTLRAMVKGRAETTRAALDHAINAGCLTYREGPHGAHILEYVRDLEVVK